jgi:hypothetical protein
MSVAASNAVNLLRSLRWGMTNMILVQRVLLTIDAKHIAQIQNGIDLPRTTAYNYASLWTQIRLLVGRLARHLP